MSGSTVWPQNAPFFGIFNELLSTQSVKRSSLRSQYWLRLFLWFSNTVICEVLIAFPASRQAIEKWLLSLDLSTYGLLKQRFLPTWAPLLLITGHVAAWKIFAIQRHHGYSGYVAAKSRLSSKAYPLYGDNWSHRCIQFTKLLQAQGQNAHWARVDTWTCRLLCSSAAGPLTDFTQAAALLEKIPKGVPRDTRPWNSNHFFSESIPRGNENG